MQRLFSFLFLLSAPCSLYSMKEYQKNNEEKEHLLKNDNDESKYTELETDGENKKIKETDVFLNLDQIKDQGDYDTCLKVFKIVDVYNSTKKETEAKKWFSKNAETLAKSFSGDQKKWAEEKDAPLISYLMLLIKMNTNHSGNLNRLFSLRTNHLQNIIDTKLYDLVENKFADRVADLLSVAHLDEKSSDNDAKKMVLLVDQINQNDTLSFSLKSLIAQEWFKKNSDWCSKHIGGTAIDWAKEKDFDLILYIMKLGNIDEIRDYTSFKNRRELIFNKLANKPLLDFLDSRTAAHYNNFLLLKNICDGSKELCDMDTNELLNKSPEFIQKYCIQNWFVTNAENITEIFGGYDCVWQRMNDSRLIKFLAGLKYMRDELEGEKKDITKSCLCFIVNGKMATNHKNMGETRFDSLFSWLENNRKEMLSLIENDVDKDKEISKISHADTLSKLKKYYKKVEKAYRDNQVKTEMSDKACCITHYGMSVILGLGCYTCCLGSLAGGITCCCVFC